MLDVRTAQDVLRKKNSAIFVLGDPRFNLEWRLHDAVHSEPFLAWTGAEFSWDDRGGDIIERGYATSAGPVRRQYVSLATSLLALTIYKLHQQGSTIRRLGNSPGD
jgi:hypothetical protein